MTSALDRRAILGALTLAPALGAAGTATSAAATDVRDGFLLRPGLVHLNSANLAAASRAVLDAERAAVLDINGDPSFENRAKFEGTTEATREALARFLRAAPDEIAITRNTSEGNRTVIAGLNLGPGDEVVIWDQNHESNNVAWDVWSRRYGFRVVRVATPASADTPERLAAAFLDRLTRRTKLLAFSHVSNRTGLALPAQAICWAAAERGVMTLVDGAQTFGVLDLDLHAMGCDAFTGSGHKWLAGPQETGVLYVRRDRVPGLWPSMVTHNWDVWSGAGARKFECLGQRQDGRILALRTAVELQLARGRPAIEATVRDLVRGLRERVADAVGEVRFVTPAAREMSAGILTFIVARPDAAAVMRTMYEDFKVSALATPYEGGTLVRFSPNIYNTAADLEVAARAVATAAGRG